MIFTIAWHEFKSLLLSPLAWIVLGVVQTLLAYLFLAQLESFAILQPRLIQFENTPGVTDMIVAPLFQLSAIILLLLMPLITMRSIAEEKHNRTLSLLISSPITIFDIVFGKFLGLYLFIITLISLLMLMPLSLSVGTALDFGKLFAIYLAMLLLLGAFAAIGLYLSSLTDNQAIAAVTTFGALFMLWIIDWLGDKLSEGQTLFGYLSLLRHHKNMLEGVFHSSDVIYYLLFMMIFLALTLRQLDRERLL